MDADSVGNLVTYQRVVRSGARNEAGDLPPDVWAQRDVAATLSPFDLGSDCRAVEVVVTHALTSSNGGADDNDARANRLVAFHMKQDPVSGSQVPALGAESGGQGVLTTDGVRRLTPLECELLQGAPAGWTDVAGQKDSPRYRQLGNAVAVPVFRWVGERIMHVEATTL